MSNIQPQTGFVGFFDILGYTQIILNNNIHKTAQFVSDTLINIPQNMIDCLKPSAGLSSDETSESLPDNTQSWRSMLDQIKWVIFSDSILVSMPFDSEISLYDQLQHYLAFATVCASLMNRSFSAGFPLRGAISVGEFFIEERCFAGRPIINAYHQAQQLEFAGCVLDTDANSFISEIRKQVVRSGKTDLLKQLDQNTILYLPPSKRDVVERQRVINWVSLDTPGFEKISGNIREVTMRAFLMHNKIAVPAVQGKLNNTEMFIRHVLTNVTENA